MIKRHPLSSGHIADDHLKKVNILTKMIPLNSLSWLVRFHQSNLENHRQEIHFHQSNLEDRNQGINLLDRSQNLLHEMDQLRNHLLPIVAEANAEEVCNFFPKAKRRWI